MDLLIHTYNFGEDEVADLCLAILQPDGGAAFWDGTTWAEEPTAWFQRLHLPNSFEIVDKSLTLGTVPEGAPEGIYTVYLGFTTPGTLEPVSEMFPVQFEVRSQ